MTKNIVVGTKLSAMKSRLLKGKDYQEMLEMKTVAEIASYLKNCEGYKSLLANLDVQTVHRETLEEKMFSGVVIDYVKLMHYYSHLDRSFFGYLVKEVEIEQLKTLLRSLGTQRTFEVSVEDYPLGYSFDFEKVAAAADPREFVEALQGSPYYNVLNQFMVSTEYLNEFDIEMNLDMYYFNYVYRSLSTRKDARKLLETFGREIDILNLLWIYRCKKYYSMDKNIIYSFLIPHYYKIKVDMVKQLVEAQTMEEVLALMKGTEYAAVFDDSNSLFYELSFKRYMSKLFSKNLKGNGLYTVAGVISYIHLRKMEIEDVISIIEGVRYGLGTGEIKKYLIWVTA